jgi:uncharacterized cupredoxin-like copper-binding protein
MPRQATLPFALFLGLMLLAGCTAGHEPITSATPSAAPASIDWSKAEEIDVTLKSFEFMPANIDLRHGKPYRLHLENQADTGHNLDAPDFFHSAVLEPGPIADKIKAAGGMVEVPPGGSADIYLVPTKAGTFDIKCSHFLHASFGMVGKIVVG